MITRTANFQSEADKRLSQPLFLAEMELDYQVCEASTEANWRRGQGDADVDSVPGSVICKTTGDDTGTNILPSLTGLEVKNSRFKGEISDRTMALCFHIEALKKWQLKSFKLKLKSTTSETVSFYVFIVPAVRGDVRPGYLDYSWDIYERSHFLQDVSLTASYQEITFTAYDFPIITDNAILVLLPEAGKTVYFETYNYRDPIIVGGYSGVGSIIAQIGEVGIDTQYLVAGYINGEPFGSRGYLFAGNLNPLEMDVDGSWVVRAPFDGYCALRDFKIDCYADSEHSSDLLVVRDRQGALVTPTVDGEVRIEEASPYGTDIELEIYKINTSVSVLTYTVSGNVMTINTSSNHGLSVNNPIFFALSAGNNPKHRGFYRVNSVTDLDTFTVLLPSDDAGDVGSQSNGTIHKLTKIGTTFQDGDILTDKQSLYVINALLTTTKFYLTPRLDAVKIYFKTASAKYVSGERAMLGHAPLIATLPNYDTLVDDPIRAKSRLAGPQCGLWIHREGVSKSMSEAERLVYNFDITGNDLTIKFGYRGLAESDFIAYNRGIVNNHKLTDGMVILECSDVLWKTKDPWGIDDAANGRDLHYPYWHPIDILIDLLQRSRIRDSFIDYDAFDAVKSLLPGWQFFYSASKDESEKLKDLREQVMALCGISVYRKEDGKVTAVLLDNGNADLVFSIDDTNSEPDGKAELNKDRRVNVCAVRRGFFWEPLPVENDEEQFWDIYTDAVSVATTGKNTQLTFDDEYPWVPRDTMIGTESLGLVIARQKVNRFKYGIPIVRRIVPAGRFLHLQIGDNGTVRTGQVLDRNRSGIINERAALLGKKLLDRSRLMLYLWLYQMQG